MMKREECKVGERVRVLIGAYAGKEGLIEAFGDAEKCVGCTISKSLVWFKPEEIELA